MDNMEALNLYIREYNNEQHRIYADNPAAIDEKDLFNSDANDGSFLMNFEDWR